MEVFEEAGDALHDDGEMRHVPPDRLLARRQVIARQLVELVEEISDAGEALAGVVIELARGEDSVSGR